MSNSSTAADQQNLRAIALMVLAMLAFAIEDMFIKFSARTISVGQILILLGLFGGFIFLGLARMRGEKVTRAILTEKNLLIRTTSEVIGTFGYTTALTLIPLSIASAILQATPLMVTMGAALILGETVGWRRWSAVVVGFIGMLMIIRPGMDGFDANSLFAVLGAVGLAMRDLITRRIPAYVPTTMISAQAFFAIAIIGIFMMFAGDGWQAVNLSTLAFVSGGIICGVLGYLAITTSARIGESSAIAPFRYARLIFGMTIGVAMFSEKIDAWVLIGSAILIATGIYAIYRERKVSRLNNLAQT